MRIKEEEEVVEKTLGEAAEEGKSQRGKDQKETRLQSRVDSESERERERAVLLLLLLDTQTHRV